MKTLNFNFNLKGLDGKDVVDSQTSQVINIGKTLANMLVGGGDKDIFKFYDWAMLIYSGSDISVDDSDYKKIYDLIENGTQLNVLYKAQILRYMDTVKTNENK